MVGSPLAPHNIHPDLAEVLFRSDEIQSRIQELGEEISRDYGNDELLLLCVLKGSMMFTSDLMRHLKPPVVLDFIEVSSYGDATESSGIVRITKDLEEEICDRNVLIVEDIVDTGLTLSYLKKHLQLRAPKSIKLCSLLSKPSRRQTPVDIDYLGFTIEDKFVIGYGMDYAGRYRNLPYIGVLSPSAVKAINNYNP